MAVFLVTYKINSPNTDRDKLTEKIKSSANGWWHYIDNVWIVNTSHEADDLAKLLYPCITKPDRLLVIGVTGEHQGWLPDKAWEWLNNNTRSSIS
jgi:hypothetical protein